jgi:hypothetical protein
MEFENGIEECQAIFAGFEPRSNPVKPSQTEKLSIRRLQVVKKRQIPALVCILVLSFPG